MIDSDRMDPPRGSSTSELAIAVGAATLPALAGLAWILTGSWIVVGIIVAVNVALFAALHLRKRRRDMNDQARSS